MKTAFAVCVIGAGGEKQNIAVGENGPEFFATYGDADMVGFELGGEDMGAEVFEMQVEDAVGLLDCYWTVVR